MDSVKDRLEELIDLERLSGKLGAVKLADRLALDRLTGALNKRRMKKATNVVIFVFALIGVAALVAGIAFLIHHYLTPAYTDDFDDDFEDFEDDDEEI